MTVNPRLHEIRYRPEHIVSFSQNREEVLIFRAFDGKCDGTFIDVGAGHPVADNVTIWLRMKGWRGINIEPNPIFFEELQRYRSDDINLNVGVGDVRATLTFFQVLQNELGHGWGLSSFDPSAKVLGESLGYRINTIPISVQTLDDIYKSHGSPRLDLLKIDVEGFEAKIVSSVDWAVIRPRLLCIEAVEPNSARPAWPKWEKYLVDAGYVFAHFDGVNCYYCDESDTQMRGQLSSPVCINDKWSPATHFDLEAALNRT